MKKILAAILVLALAIPALADVAITATDAGNQYLLISFSTSGGPPAPAVRGIALTLNVTGGVITAATNYDTVTPSAFNVFIDYAFTTGAGYTIGTGHPFARETLPGVPTFPINAGNAFAVSMGHLGQGSPGLTSGVIAKIKIDGITPGGSATVAISANARRGGAAVGILGNITVQSPVVIAGPPETETVSPPATPTGLAEGFITVAYTDAFATTGGSVSSMGHTPIEYRFNFGNGKYTTWGAALTASTVGGATPTYTVGGTVNITVEARCQTHPTITAVSAPLSFLVRQCQFYNLTQKIGGLADNVVNATDVTKIVTYINTYKVSTAVWAVVPTVGGAPNPNYDARYNLSTAQPPINAADVSALVTYINANKISTAVWAVNCAVKP